MNQEWEKLGKDIRNIVEDAVNSQNFSQLNKTISNTKFGYSSRQKKTGFISEKYIYKSRRFGIDNLRLHFKCRIRNCSSCFVSGLFIFGGVSSWNKDCTVDIISFIDWQCNDDLAREQYVVGVKTIS